MEAMEAMAFITIHREVVVELVVIQETEGMEEMLVMMEPLDLEVQVVDVLEENKEEEAVRVEAFMLWEKAQVEL